MKTQSINWSVDQRKSNSFAKRTYGHQETISPQDTAQMRKAVASAIETTTPHIVRGSIATVVVMAILTAAVWASESLVDSGVIQAIIWASGFVFLALAIDASAARFKALLASSLSMGVLALLSSPQATEFIMLAAAIIATWAAWAILQGWKD